MSSRLRDSNYKRILHEYVASTTNVYDLILILQSIPFDKIKNFINQHIDSSKNTSWLKKTYFNDLSINQLFPDAITQYILSFGGLYHTKSVCKKWNQFSNKNERIWLTQQYNTINQSESPLKYDKILNNTWIIHPYRTILHEIEIDSGYKGPMNDIRRTIAKCSSGDRIFIHEGTYYEQETLIIPHNLQIIGIGANVTFVDTSYERTFCEIEYNPISTNLYLENIIIDCSKNDNITEGAIHIGSCNKLWIKNCKFKLNDVGIMVRNAASLDVTNCEFEGASNAIEISPIAEEVNVKESIFKNCGIETEESNSSELGCILLYDDYTEVNYNNIDEFVRLECVGNIFEDNLCYPIAERHPPNGHHTNDKFIIDTNRYILKDNVLRGQNGNDKQMKINDANKLYYNNC